MAYFTLLQAGSSVQLMDSAGALTTLTLPTGVTIDSTKTPHFTIFGRYVVMVNSPTRPITIDLEGAVRVLTPRPPRTKPVLTGQAGGTLSGTFQVRQSFIILDVDGNVIAESDLGPASTAVTISAQFLKAASLDLSPDAISASRLYRTTTNGSVYFPWITLDGNVQTSIQDDLGDTGLSLASAPSFGSPPDLVMIKEFRERLWGRSRTDVDSLRYTEAEAPYAWPSSDVLKVPRVGSDDRGITSIITRREGLAVARQDVIYAVQGENTANFRLVKMKESVGVEAEESVVNYRDTVYFLSKNGVYTWDDAGIKCISDGKTRNWFVTDTYFNRSKFRLAVGRIDPIKSRYQLLLSNVGSSNLDRWIEYDISSQTWWGPHLTSAFTPTAGSTIYDPNSLQIPIFGSSNGFIWKEQDTRTDDTNTAIDMNLDSKFMDGGTPDIMKFWSEPAIISKVQPAGSLTITPTVGDLNSAAGSAITADMTLGRQRLPRLGTGRFAQLNFDHNGVGQNVVLYGLEIPFSELGRR